MLSQPKQKKRPQTSNLSLDFQKLKNILSFPECLETLFIIQIPLKYYLSLINLNIFYSIFK